MAGRMISRYIRERVDLTEGQKDRLKVEIALIKYNEFLLQVMLQKEQGIKYCRRPDFAARARMIENQLVVNLNFRNGKFIPQVGHLPGSFLFHKEVESFQELPLLLS